MGSSSFSDLNTFGNEMVSFTDDRAYAVTITGAVNDSNAINANEGDTLSFLWNQTLTELISPVALPSTANLTIEVNVSSAVAPPLVILILYSQMLLVKL